MLSIPGSNNAHTAGRTIDTYDRAYDGSEAPDVRERDHHDHEELLHARNGNLTDTGYLRDDFVVDDNVVEYAPASQTTDTPAEQPAEETTEETADQTPATTPYYNLRHSTTNHRPDYSQYQFSDDDESEYYDQWHDMYDDMPDSIS